MSEYRFVKNKFQEEIVYMVAKHYFLKNALYLRNLIF
jgi:hypothetical protein